MLSTILRWLASGLKPEVYDWRVRQEGEGWILEAEEECAGAPGGAVIWCSYGQFATQFEAAAEGQRRFGPRS